ncbi:hypothetical protein ES707_16743 [subsurface metagenome]
MASKVSVITSKARLGPLSLTTYTSGATKAIFKLTSRRGRRRRGLVYSPFARRQHILAQRASANFTTGATATMALVLWNQEYYTTMDMVSPKR